MLLRRLRAISSSSRGRPWKKRLSESPPTLHQVDESHHGPCERGEGDPRASGPKMYSHSAARRRGSVSCWRESGLLPARLVADVPRARGHAGAREREEGVARADEARRAHERGRRAATLVDDVLGAELAAGPERADVGDARLVLLAVLLAAAADGDPRPGRRGGGSGGPL